MVVSRFPYPLEKGDKLRAFYQLIELQKAFNVHLVAISHRIIPADERKKVEAHCSELSIHHQKLIHKLFESFLALISNKPIQVGYFYNRSAQRQINKWIKDKKFKYGYVQLVRCAEYIKEEHHMIKTIDYQDAFSMGVARRIEKQAWHKKWLFKLETKRLRNYESRMFDFYEHKTMISEQDAQFIMHPDAKKIECIPNGIAPSFFEELNIDKTHDFVFVGNMSYPPNIEAVEYICERILPHFPDKKLLISGSSPHARVKKLDQLPQVELTGWVNDIRDSYARGKIFLAPMMIGTGMQNKLLEAMAMGVPCVTTSLANNAIAAKHEDQIMVAENPSEFVEAIQRLNEQTNLYHKIAQNARQYVLDKYTWAKATSPLIELIQKKVD